VFASGKRMNSGLGNSLFCALLASTCVGAAEAAEVVPAATVSSPTRIDGLLSGAADDTDGGNAFASPTSVTLAAAKEIGESSGQLKVWLEEVLGAVGAITLTSAAVLAYRRKRRARNARLQNLYEITEMPTSLSERQTPRYLPNNPYVDISTPELLSRQIENAAEASLEFGRVLGVVYFDLGPRPQGDFSDETREWEADHADLMEKLRKALRKTDHVAELSDREIVACIALLPGKTELLTIAARLRKIGQSSPRFASAFAPEAGLAIYPACGYRGEELIEHAKSDFHRKPPAMAYLPLNAQKLQHLAYPKG